MIDLYTWNTSNGRKASIMLEELGVAYNVHPIDINNSDQFSDEYKKINPNSKIPALVDSEGPDGKPITVFESGAILIYLADKFGKFIPTDARGRYAVQQWLMWQMGGVGPIFGQVHHFLRAAPEAVPYAIERYSKECRRLYAVLDAQLNTQLSAQPYVAGDYSIADIAIFPWVARHEWQKVDLAEFPAVKRWFDTIGARPAVQRGLKIPAV